MLNMVRVHFSLEFFIVDLVVDYLTICVLWDHSSSDVLNPIDSCAMMVGRC